VAQYPVLLLAPPASGLQQLPQMPHLTTMAHRIGGQVGDLSTPTFDYATQTA
jgi:hypothetical protein